MADPLRFSLDGVDVAVDVDPKTSTLDVLRDHLGVYTSKAGCAPQGLCGCCTVLVDGKPRLTCTLPVKSVIGKQVTTLSGVDEAARMLLADCFVAEGASQCGYCTPGIVLSTHALLTATPEPTREEITRALNLHTCRCTGYTAIYAAVERAAACRRGAPAPEANTRPEGREIALGDRPFVDDLVRPGMLHGAVVFATSAYGVVTRVDTAAAEAIAGVHRVLVLRGAGAVVAHHGDAVVLVAAESRGAARAAAAAVVVEMEAGVGPERTCIEEQELVVGEVGAAFAGAKHHLEDELVVAAGDPVFLEPEAALAVPSDDGLVVYSATHDAAAAQEALSAEVGAPVRVILVPSGGSYGGKAGLTVEPWAARLARATGRPVRISLDLEEGMRVHPKRAAATVRVQLAASDAGLLGARLALDLDAGVAPVDPRGMLEAALGAFAYRVPHQLTVRVFRSAAPSTGPIRGAGAIPMVFAMERAMDALARVLRKDPLDVRAGAVDADGAAMIAAARALSGPTTSFALARTGGQGGARVALEVVDGSTIEVRCNVPELGQGRDEALCAALVRATGLPAETFSFPWSDGQVGSAALGPVEEAAFAAGRALAEGGGGLAERIGTVLIGASPREGVPGWSAQVVTRDAEGAVTGLTTLVAIGPAQDPAIAKHLAEGAAHMGIGVALSEESELVDGLPEARFRMLGVLKPKGSPPIAADCVVLEGGARDVSDAAVAATAAAIANAVSAHEASGRRALPMKDSAAARAVGVRPKRPERAA